MKLTIMLLVQRRRAVSSQRSEGTTSGDCLALQVLNMKLIIYLRTLTTFDGIMPLYPWLKMKSSVYYNN